MAAVVGTIAVLVAIAAASALITREQGDNGGRSSVQADRADRPAASREEDAADRPAARPAPDPAFQAHSMVYSCCMAPAAKRTLFAAAKRSGASMVRVDIEVNGIVQPRPGGGTRYDWAKTDETLSLAEQAGLDVVGVLTGTPDQLAKCPPGTPAAARPSCPPADPRAYARVARRIFAHARGRVAGWELLNEPDLSKNFRGGPAAYGRLLGLVYPEAKRVSPDVPVLNGGIASPGHARWLRRAVAGGARFDVANGHLRGPADSVGAATRRYRQLFEAATGRRMPLWITETGYPARPGPGQEDPAYRGADAVQAAYLARALPAMRRAGAREVFVTLRDGPEFGPESPYRWEGLTAWDGARASDRRALGTVAALNRGERPGR